MLSWKLQSFPITNWCLVVLTEWIAIRENNAVYVERDPDVDCKPVWTASWIIAVRTVILVGIRVVIAIDSQRSREWRGGKDIRRTLICRSRACQINIRCHWKSQNNAKHLCMVCIQARAIIYYTYVRIGRGAYYHFIYFIHSPHCNTTGIDYFGIL